MGKIRRKYKIYLIPIILVFISVVIILYGQYNNTIDIIKSEYKAKINLIEQSIYNETKYTDIISKIAERDLEGTMEENSKLLVEEYQQNPNVLEWDLIGLKDKLDNMDIYILDQELTVIASTISSEVGSNFSSYKDFSKTLRERLAGDKFESDSINFSIETDELKKYSYMPSPDNKYLLELSVTIQDVYPELESLNIVYLSKDLQNKYSFVEDIRIYKFDKEQQISHGLKSSSNKSDKYRSLNKNKEYYIKKAYETKKTQTIIVKDKNKQSYTLKYIPYSSSFANANLTWWNPYVMEVLYDNQTLTDKIAKQKKLFLQSMAIISTLYFGFSFVIISLVAKNQEIASRDHLTKLPNRKRFDELLGKKIEEANKKKTKIAVMFFDLDKLKVINDTWGHNVGDKALKEVANRIKSEIPEGDLVSRLGGDEFTALISGIRSDDEVIKIAHKMSALFENTLKIRSQEISIRTSIGISIYPDHGDTVEDLIVKADDAMYVAKHAQIGYKIYDGV